VSKNPDYRRIFSADTSKTARVRNQETTISFPPKMDCCSHIFNAHGERKVDKLMVREAMLSLEREELESAKEKYFEYVARARLDRSEPIENDEQAQAEIASDLSEALDDAVHNHSDKVSKLRTIDFGPKVKVEEGAIVKFGGRYFVISVSTGMFSCDGNEVMGISAQAPIYAAIEDKRRGDFFTYNGRKLVIEDLT
jgi:hypothetical protein